MTTGYDTIVEELIGMLKKTPQGGREMSAETTLVGDLGLESIQVIEYLCEVEDHYDLAIDEDRLADVQSVGDLAGVVAGMLRN